MYSYMQNFKKKVLSLVSNGIEPLEVGIRNFKHPDLDVELLANERAKTHHLRQACVYANSCTQNRWD